MITITNNDVKFKNRQVIHDFCWAIKPSSLFERKGAKESFDLYFGVGIRLGIKYCQMRFEYSYIFHTYLVG